MALTDAINDHLFADDAAHVLARYLNFRDYSGAWFDTIGGRGDAPDVAHRFTPADLVAVSTLSVTIPGWVAVELLDRRAEEFSDLLTAIPQDTDLHEATDEDLDAVFALQDALDTVTKVGHVTRSKLLARKRPRLVPIRDQHVLLALVGRKYGSFTRPLGDALRDSQEIRDRLEALRSQHQEQPLSLLRVLDIVVWMREHGDAAVA